MGRFILTARDHVDNRNFGCASYVRLGIFVDDLLHSQLKFAGNVKDIFGAKQNRVLVLAALAAFPALEAELAVQVHQLPLDFLCAALCR
jgi:hypothetical protein